MGGETGWDRLGQFSGCQAGVAAEVCVCVGGVGCFTWLQGLYTAGGWGEWVAEWVDGGCEWVTEQQMVGGRSQRSHLVMSL